MIKLGLTGSIGMGKSTAAHMLRFMGIPVHDADACVHALMGPKGQAVQAIGHQFPSALGKASRREENVPFIDRKALATLVLPDPVALAKLEAILHPLVQAESQAFLAHQQRAGRKIAALDIPLLFETGREKQLDKVLVVSAPAFIQRQRVWARPGMSEAKFAAILAKQMPDAEKRRRADFLVPSGLGKAITFRTLTKVLRKLKKID